MTIDKIGDLVLAVVLGAIIGVVFIYLITNVVNKVVAKFMTANWKIGDKVVCKDKNGFCILTGWNLDSFYVDYNGCIHELSYNKLVHNKSAHWRKAWTKCTTVMGEAPAFTYIVADNDISSVTPQAQSASNSDDILNGKDIATLNETECQIYLKIALNKEKYEIAEQIKKRLEFFR